MLVPRLVRPAPVVTCLQLHATAQSVAHVQQVSASNCHATTEQLQGLCLHVLLFRPVSVVAVVVVSAVMAKVTASVPPLERKPNRDAPRACQ